MDQLLKMECGDQLWYCARTQCKHEHIAARNLRGRLGLEVFSPRLRVERATRRGVVRTVEPLFPCYVFVRCHLAKDFDDVRHTFGVSNLVHFGQSIPAISAEVIEGLRRCFEAEAPMEVVDCLAPGAQVSVVEGPFLGTRGIVVRSLPARQRVAILLDFLGQTTLTEMDRKSLSVVDRSMADLLPALAVPDQSRVSVAVAG